MPKENTNNNWNLLDDIVDIILNKNFTTKQLWIGTKSINPRKLDEDIVEPKKEFKGILTDFVITNFIDLSSQTEIFIKTIVYTFEYAINKYKNAKSLSENSIFFIYKGGNVLRIISTETENKFPGLVSDELKNYYKDSFKKSDADFSIYIDPKLQNFDEIFNDMVNMSFLLENQLRNIFLSDPTKFFQFYKLNFHEKQTLMITQLDKLNASETVKNKLYGFDGQFNSLIFGNQIASKSNLDDYEIIPKEDFEIGFEGKEAPKGIKYVYDTNLKPIHLLTNNDPLYNNLKNIILTQKMIFGNKSYSDIFVSVNKSTVFIIKKIGGEDIVISFNLVRTKFTFDAYFIYKNGNSKIMKLDGELIDVSIINKDYSTLSHFYDHINKYITTYEVGIGDSKFNFKGYTVEYLISDLEFILFSVSEYPWDDLKYTKRIKRLLYLYFIFLLINKKFNTNNRIQYIDNINRIFDNIEIFLKTGNEQYKIKTLILIRDYFKSIKNINENIRENPFGNLIKKIAIILISSNIDKEQFLKFINILKENTAIMIKSLKGIKEYIKSEGSINEDSIYKAEVLSGGKEIVYLN